MLNVDYDLEPDHVVDLLGDRKRGVKPHRVGVGVAREHPDRTGLRLECARIPGQVETLGRLRRAGQQDCTADREDRAEQPAEAKRGDPSKRSRPGRERNHASDRSP